MNNVLLLFESIEPTNKEIAKVLGLLAERGIFQLRKCISYQVSAEDIDWCDVVLSVRSTSAMEWRLARYAKRCGKYWILLLDDDFLSLDRNYGKDGQGYQVERKKSLRRLLKYVDCLLAVNQLLAEKYVKIGGISKYVLTNTAIDYHKLFKPQQNVGKIKIVFYVNDGTSTMFDRYLLPVIPKLCDRYSECIALYFLALKPALKEYEDQIEIHYVPHMPFDEFTKYMAEEHFDIGLAPLDEEGFSKYKYFNKYIEYTRAGIAGIYTDCTLYRQVIQSGYNGILCDNSTDSWLNAIIKLVDNTAYRMEIAENAQEYARQNFSVNTIVDKLLQDIPELGGYKATKSRIGNVSLLIIKAHYWGFRVRGWCYTAYSCIRSGHIKSLTSRIAKRLS